MLLSAKKEKTSQGKEVFFFLRWITEVFFLSKPLYQCGILISADNNDQGEEKDNRPSRPTSSPNAALSTKKGEIRFPFILSSQGYCE